MPTFLLFYTLVRSSGLLRAAGRCFTSHKRGFFGSKTVLQLSQQSSWLSSTLMNYYGLVEWEPLWLYYAFILSDSKNGSPQAWRCGVYWHWRMSTHLCCCRFCHLETCIFACFPTGWCHTGIHICLHANWQHSNSFHNNIGHVLKEKQTNIYATREC